MKVRGRISIELHQIFSFSKKFGKTSKSNVIFWPGCSLASLSNDSVTTLLEILKISIPSIELSTLCCGKPSHFINNLSLLKKRESYIVNDLKAMGVKKIYTACPNCFNTLSKILDLEIIPIWSEIEKNLPKKYLNRQEGLTTQIHDPCESRNDKLSQDAVRGILKKLGATIVEFPNSRERTHCCGKKNMALYLDPIKGQKLLSARKKEITTSHVTSYCASCIGAFHHVDVHGEHIAELIAGKSCKSSWINRFKLTKYVKSGGEKC